MREHVHSFHTAITTLCLRDSTVPIHLAHRKAASTNGTRFKTVMHFRLSRALRRLLQLQSALVGMLVVRRLLAASHFHSRFRCSAFWQGFAVLGDSGAAFPLLEPLFSQPLSYVQCCKGGTDKHKEGKSGTLASPEERTIGEKGHLENQEKGEFEVGEIRNCMGEWRKERRTSPRTPGQK